MSGKSHPVRDKAGARVVEWMLLGLVVLAGGLYAAAYAVTGDKVPRGASVEGVAIGGLEPAAAEQALHRGLGDRADAPITVVAAGERRSLHPGQAGLSVDLEASVVRAGGVRSWRPARLWDYFTGGDDVDAVVAVDRAALSRAVADLADEVDRAPVEGKVTFARGEAVPHAPKDGVRLSTQGSVPVLRGVYLTDEVARLPVRVASPEVGSSDVRMAMREFARPAVSAPLLLVHGDQTVRVPPRRFARALSMRPRGGVLVPHVDGERLARVVEQRKRIGRRPRDARFKVVGGKPRVVPSRRGVRLDPDRLADRLPTVLTRTGEHRRLRLAAAVRRPGFSTADARKLGITERVSSFATSFPYSESGYRNTNLGRAAERIDGTALRPGETFSLNDVVGERTAANGFVRGYIIDDGVYKLDYGGGVSQVATTTFNAAFFAGMTDVEHQPHSFYIDRYPVGREATVAWGSIDLRFRNDMPSGVLIKASITPATPSSRGRMQVSMYSTKYWDITATTSERYDETEPETRYRTNDQCVPHQGYAGFSVDVTRIFRRHDRDDRDPVVHRERMHTTYAPSDTVVCGPEPASS